MWLPDQKIGAGDYGAMRETVKHRETGWLVRNFEELVEAVKQVVPDQLGENEPWQWMRKNCQERAALFTVDRMISRVEELCKEAIETGGW